MMLPSPAVQFQSVPLRSIALLPQLLPRLKSARPPGDIVVAILLLRFATMSHLADEVICALPPEHWTISDVARATSNV
jgi:hypothetical protein